MANASTLAGHVEIEDFARIGGMTPSINFPYWCYQWLETKSGYS